jgi:hypothetical protein
LESESEDLTSQGSEFILFDEDFDEKLINDENLKELIGNDPPKVEKGVRESPVETEPRNAEVAEPIVNNSRLSKHSKFNPKSPEFVPSNSNFGIHLRNKSKSKKGDKGKEPDVKPGFGVLQAPPVKTVSVNGVEFEDVGIVHSTISKFPTIFKQPDIRSDVTKHIDEYGSYELAFNSGKCARDNKQIMHVTNCPWCSYFRSMACEHPTVVVAFDDITSSKDDKGEVELQNVIDNISTIVTAPKPKYDEIPIKWIGFQAFLLLWYAGSWAAFCVCMLSGYSTIIPVVLGSGSTIVGVLYNIGTRPIWNSLISNFTQKYMYSHFSAQITNFNSKMKAAAINISKTYVEKRQKTFESIGLGGVSAEWQNALVSLVSVAGIGTVIGIYVVIRKFFGKKKVQVKMENGATYTDLVPMFCRSLGMAVMAISIVVGLLASVSRLTSGLRAMSSIYSIIFAKPIDTIVEKGVVNPVVMNGNICEEISSRMGPISATKSSRLSLGLSPLNYTKGYPMIYHTEIFAWHDEVVEMISSRYDIYFYKDDKGRYEYPAFNTQKGYDLLGDIMRRNPETSKSYLTEIGNKWASVKLKDGRTLLDVYPSMPGRVATFLRENYTTSENYTKFRLYSASYKNTSYLVMAYNSDDVLRILEADAPEYSVTDVMLNIKNFCLAHKGKIGIVLTMTCLMYLYVYYEHKARMENKPTPRDRVVRTVKRGREAVVQYLYPPEPVPDPVEVAPEAFLGINSALRFGVELSTPPVSIPDLNLKKPMEAVGLLDPPITKPDSEGFGKSRQVYRPKTAETQIIVNSAAPLKPSEDIPDRLKRLELQMSEDRDRVSRKDFYEQEFDRVLSHLDLTVENEGYSKGQRIAKANQLRSNERWKNTADERGRLRELVQGWTKDLLDDSNADNQSQYYISKGIMDATNRLAVIEVELQDLYDKQFAGAYKPKKGNNKNQGQQIRSMTSADKKNMRRGGNVDKYGGDGTRESALCRNSPNCAKRSAGGTSGLCGMCMSKKVKSGLCFMCDKKVTREPLNSRFCGVHAPKPVNLK